jgi:hypothetical protein
LPCLFSVNNKATAQWRGLAPRKCQFESGSRGMSPSRVQLRHVRMFPSRAHVEWRPPVRLEGRGAGARQGGRRWRSAQSTGQYESISCKRKMALLGQPQRVLLVCEWGVISRQLRAVAPRYDRDRLIQPFDALLFSGRRTPRNIISWLRHPTRRHHARDSTIPRMPSRRQFEVSIRR